MVILVQKLRENILFESCKHKGAVMIKENAQRETKVFEKIIRKF